ncbi:MAG: VCBS repeat-containing protein [Vicinamibacterales bacterium]|jgi:hypothetical protein|nr:VCBS repeat-containing protein [Vicinamibacterales bacterium]HJO18238.1 VCBS repeat-containing protein [Vicinamibacterales bacterium]|tara:strand:- start:13173 stop:14522 length:1350 start_codon:yes stop_codon:yes gene_type:complete
MAYPRPSLLFGLAALAIIIFVPWFLVSREAERQGRSVNELIGLIVALRDDRAVSTPVDKRAERRFFERRSIGRSLGGSQPWISHVNIVDLDQDGFTDVVLCDATMNQVAWIRQEVGGSFTETLLGDAILAPAHVTPSDVDLDGDIDLLVAKMGAILPNNDKIGSVVVLENDGQEEFTTRILLDGLARVTDIEPGDFDGDGDIDLVVGQFGYDDGEIRWMENLGGWNFESHSLLELSGTIHTPVGDLDGDGDLDVAAVVSQEWEEIYVFENDGKGMFDRHLIYGATNDDFGSSGISLVDLDLDGDLDVLYSNGDAFDYIPPGPRPWHGVQWLENKGDLRFTYHRIGDFPGAYFANAVDGDLDGDLDVFVVSAFNDWDSPEAASLAWFQNDGEMEFARRILATEPTHLLALASADMDGDGLVDLVTGAMHVSPPYDRMSRVTLWRNTWRDP